LHCTLVCKHTHNSLKQTTVPFFILNRLHPQLFFLFAITHSYYMLSFFSWLHACNHIFKLFCNHSQNQGAIRCFCQHMLFFALPPMFLQTYILMLGAKHTRCPQVLQSQLTSSFLQPHTMFLEVSHTGVC
jgi:hypothetical protein